jgi:hypothetical protein
MRRRILLFILGFLVNAPTQQRRQSNLSLVEDFTQHTRREGSTPAAQLKDRIQPFGGTGGRVDGRELDSESWHDERLSEHALLESIE